MTVSSYNLLSCLILFNFVVFGRLNNNNNNVDNNNDLKAVFMPYYTKSQMGKEVAAINNVTARRLEDKRTFTRKNNPYCVFYAVYNFAPEPEWEALVQAMLNARKNDVKVQVLVDAQQLESYKVWNLGLLDLIKAGFKYSPTQLNLTIEEQDDYELIGINTSMRGNGLMHLKTRLFKWEDYQTFKKHAIVMTGSFNPEIGPAPEYGFLNNDTFMEIHDMQTIKKYENKYLAVRGNKNIVNQWNESSPLNVLFSPDPKGPQPVNKILEWVNMEDEVIFIWVFTLRNIINKENRSLYDSLLDAKDRGVQIVVATDANMVENSTYQLNRNLRKHGIPVYLCNNTAGAFVAMHAKNAMMGITQPHIITDTCNWTGGALSNPKWLPIAINDESILMINCTKTSGYKHLGVEFTSNFLALLRSYENQPLNSDQPKVQAIVDTLSDNIKTWREIEIDFQLKTNDDDQKYDGRNGSYVLMLQSIHGSGGKSWSMMRHLKRSKNIWSTDGTIKIPHGRSLNYIYGRITNDNIIWERCKFPRYLIADPAFPFQVDVVARNVNTLQMEVFSSSFCTPSNNIF